MSQQFNSCGKHLNACSMDTKKCTKKYSISGTIITVSCLYYSFSMFVYYCIAVLCSEVLVNQKCPIGAGIFFKIK